MVERKVRPLIKDDYLLLSRFLAERTSGLFSESFWLDRFQYWWEENLAMEKGISRGWMLYDDYENVVGFFGNIPVKYSIDGKIRVVCCATSWYMTQNFRDRSLELLSPFLNQGYPLLDTTPSGNVLKILLKLGFISLDYSWLKREYFYPVDIRSFYNSFINRGCSNKIVLLFLKSVGLGAILCIKSFQIISRLCLPRGDNYTIKEIRCFDSSYTLLWDKLKDKYKVIAVRRAADLNWFFFGSPLLLATRRVIEIRDNKGLIGYAAVKLGNHVLGQNISYYFELIDVFVIKENKGVYFTLFKGFLELAKKSDKIITYIKINAVNKVMARCLLKFGFLSRKTRGNFLYKGFNTESKNFYATPLDGDRCFFP